jgi:hypothetical protein
VSEFSLKAAREWLVANPTVASLNVNAYAAALDEIERLCAPRTMLLWCPQCTTRHIDEGEFATKPHHTHACQSCGHVWRPAIEPTYGVRFLPGFKNEKAKKAASTKGFCPLSVPFGDGTQKCACHGVATRSR